MIVAHIDMDSYFASVEQQANPALRGKNVVVSGKEGSRTVIVAASKEAKKFGVKTAMTTIEARRLCPRLLFVEPDGKKYWEVHRKFMSIFKQFTEQVEVFSIDEAFLDLTSVVKDFSEAEKLIQSIKAQMKVKIGEVVTCSAGIAKNKFLAKLASDLKKPNGIVVVNDQNVIEILDGCKLSDFCGIGRRINERLDDMGIETVKKLRACSLENLIKEFGPHAGNHLYNMARGEDDSIVVSEDFAPKSVSRSYTMNENTVDKKKILQLILILSEKCGRELRAQKLAGKTIQIYFRFGDFSHAGLRVTLPVRINDGLAIYNIGEAAIKKYRLPKAVRLVGVRVENLAEHLEQQSLWLPERKRGQLMPFLDKINDKYGEFTIKAGLLTDADAMREKVGGFRYESD